MEKRQATILDLKQYRKETEDEDFLPWLFSCYFFMTLKVQFNKQETPFAAYILSISGSYACVSWLDSFIHFSAAYLGPGCGFSRLNTVSQTLFSSSALSSSSSRRIPKCSQASRLLLHSMFVNPAQCLHCCWCYISMLRNKIQRYHNNFTLDLHAVISFHQQSSYMTMYS